MRVQCCKKKDPLGSDGSYENNVTRRNAGKKLKPPIGKEVCVSRCVQPICTEFKPHREGGLLDVIGKYEREINAMKQETNRRDLIFIRAFYD